MFPLLWSLLNTLFMASLLSSITVFLLVFLPSSLAQPFFPISSPSIGFFKVDSCLVQVEGKVCDPDGILSAAEAAQVDEALANLERNTLREGEVVIQNWHTNAKIFSLLEFFEHLPWPMPTYGPQIASVALQRDCRPRECKSGRGEGTRSPSPNKSDWSKDPGPALALHSGASLWAHRSDNAQPWARLPCPPIPVRNVV